MSYPVPGSPQPVPGAGYAPVPPAPGPAPVPGGVVRGPVFALKIGIAALGVIDFLLGFAPYLASKPFDMGNGKSAGGGVRFHLLDSTGGGALLGLALAGGLLAGLSLLPRQQWTAPAAVLSLVSFLGLTIHIVKTDDMTVEWGGWLLIFLLFVQVAVSVLALLFELRVLKVGANTAAPQGGFPGQPAPPPYGPGPAAPYGPGAVAPSPYGPGVPQPYSQSGAQPYSQSGSQPQPYAQPGTPPQPYSQSGSQPTYGQPPAGYGQPYGGPGQ